MNSLDPAHCRIIRCLPLLAALAGAFVGVTAGWLVVALLTPGDFAEQGGMWILPALAAPGAAAAWVGYESRSRRGLIVLACIALSSLAFWAAAPRGFWVTPPPRLEAR